MSKFFDFGDSGQDPPKKVVPKIKKTSVTPKIKQTKPKKFIHISYNKDKVFNTSGYTFKFAGKSYECIGDDKDFQIIQFRFIIETHDWVTMRNRILNQMLYGPDLKEI